MHIALIEFRNSTPYPVQLANALGHMCRVTLMLPDTATLFTDYIDRDKVELRIFHMPKLRSLSNLMMLRRMLQQMKTLKPDLVHIGFWHLWGTPGLGMLTPFPLIATVHDVKRHPGERGVWAIPTFLYRWQWRWADQIIVHAVEARQQLITQHGIDPDMVNVIPFGAYDYYRIFALPNIAEKPDTILFFGRIWDYKGLEYLIKAEPIITEAIPSARIIIAGHGEDFGRYEQAMVNPQHFEVHNYRIPDKKVAEFFQSANVVVLPYTEASQSGIISIAYAFGKPVVATNVGGIPDIVTHGETGYLVEPKDPNSLAEAIIALLKDREGRLAMGSRAKEKGENELSWTRIAKKTLHVYNQALGKH
jgi:glycosyltransferase involved in cell wall biosynthesis